MWRNAAYTLDPQSQISFKTRCQSEQGNRAYVILQWCRHIILACCVGERAFTLPTLLCLCSGLWPPTAFFIFCVWCICCMGLIMSPLVSAGIRTRLSKPVTQPTNCEMVERNKLAPSATQQSEYNEAWQWCICTYWTRYAMSEKQLHSFRNK